MFRINVADYKITAKTPDGQAVTVPYDVRDSMATILLNPQQKLNGTALLRANVVAQKILDSAMDVVLLEDAEYLMLRDATDKTVGFDRSDVELINRIMYAEKVQVRAVEACEYPESKKEDNNDTA